VKNSATGFLPASKSNSQIPHSDFGMFGFRISAFHFQLSSVVGCPKTAAFVVKAATQNVVARASRPCVPDTFDTPFETHGGTPCH